MCGRPAYSGVPVTFVYAVLQPPDPNRRMRHNVRFGVGARLQQLTKMRMQITHDWLAATNIEADECMTSNATSLIDVQGRHRRRPVVGNFTRYTFDIAKTYEVRFHRLI